MNASATSKSEGKATAAEPSPAVPKVPFVMISCPLLSDKTLLPADKLILGAMLQYGYGSGVCTASNEAIGDACGMSGRSVRRQLPTLSKWITIVRVEQSEANPVGREIYLDWTKDPARHPQQREGRIAKGGVANLATGGDGQLGHRIKPLTLSTRERDRSPLIPQGGTGSKKDKESPSSQFQRQRKCNSSQAVPEPSGNPDRIVDVARAQVPKVPTPPASPASLPPPAELGVDYDIMNNGTVSIAYKRDGEWLPRRNLDAAGHEAMLVALGGLKHDHEAVGKWFADYDARLQAQGEQAVKAQAAAMDEAELQEQYKAAGISLTRAESIMGLYRQGGKVRVSAAKHLTPLMLRFMSEQGGKYAEFARDIDIVGATAGAGHSGRFVVPEQHVDNVVKLALSLTEGHDRKKVDPFADALVACFSEPHSRKFYCDIGHALLKGELRQHGFRDALVHCLERKTQVKSRPRLFTARIKAMWEPSVMRRQAVATRYLQTA